MTSVVAVLGTGIMGAPMALNLAHAGFQVRAWNRTAGKARDRLSGQVDVYAEHPMQLRGLMRS